MTPKEYINKIKGQRDEQYNKVRELKIVVAMAARDIAQGHQFTALGRLLGALDLAPDASVNTLELIVANLQKADQNERGKHVQG